MFGFCSSAAGSMLLVGRGLLVEEKVLYLFILVCSLPGVEKRERFVSGLKSRVS